MQAALGRTVLRLDAELVAFYQFEELGPVWHYQRSLAQNGTEASVLLLEETAHKQQPCCLISRMTVHEFPEFLDNLAVHKFWVLDVCGQ